VGCVKDSQSLDNYFNFEIFYTTWMEESSLQLNTSKTKQMSLSINGEEVEQVQ